MIISARLTSESDFFQIAFKIAKLAKLKSPKRGCRENFSVIKSVRYSDDDFRSVCRNDSQ